MNKSKKRIARSAELLLVALMLGGGSIALTGCEEGPLEEAGEELDNAADEVGDALD